MFGTQSGGTLILSGLPVQEQRHLYGQVACSQAPEARNGVTLQGARLLALRALGVSPRLGRGLWHHCPHFVAWGLRGRALYGGPTQSSALGVRDARTASGHFAGSHRDLDADPAPD